MNKKILTLVVVSFGLLFAAVLTRRGDLAWMAVPFLVYLGVGIWQAPAPERVQLEAGRSLNKTSPGGQAVVEVCVTVRNHGPALDFLTLSDPSLPGMEITEGKRQQQAALAPNGEARLEYTFQAWRGRFAWETVRVTASDPLGLIEVPLDLPAEAEVLVQPEIQKFRSIPWRPRSTLHTAGSIPARRGGSGTDFWGVREYHPGDSLRWLDWRLTARHPRKFYTKEFEQEEIADIALVLDARRKTDLHLGADSLFEHGVSATASLAEVFLRQGNRVSLLLYGEDPVSLFPGYGKVQLNHILRTLAEARPEPEGSFNSLEFIPIRMFSSNSLIVVISPLAPGDWRLFPRLRAHRYPVLLISPDPFEYLPQVLPARPNQDLALRAAQVERRLDLRRIEQLWIPVIDWQVSQPLAPQVRNILSRPMASLTRE